MSDAIRYEIVEFDLDAHEFVVELVVPPAGLAAVTVSLPAWLPGSYMIRDFARHVTEIAAVDQEGPLPLQKLDKQTWRSARCSGEVVFQYRVYAFDLSVRGAYLDWTRAYFNGACIFLCVEEMPDAPWQLYMQRPPTGLADGWQVATTLPVIDVDDAGFGLYGGQGYPDLIDHPVEIGEFRRGRFEVGSVVHYFAVTDGGQFDMDRLLADVQPVCAEHVAMFGCLPVDRYLFLTLATAEGYGGLEHADSTSLICKRSDLPAAKVGRPEKNYRQFLALCSHEYFHLWNVKRIKPAAFLAGNLAAETHTELLWAFEGITSYYDELALARAGVLRPEEYLDMLASTVTRLLRNPGQRRQSLAASSFDAWTKFYKQDENGPNAIVSYYTKGTLVALGLDVVLREASGDALSLDDLMRRLWIRYGTGASGIAERGVELEVAALLGKPLDEFFHAYVYGTVELPLESWFGKLGIGYRARAAVSQDDQGGYQPQAPVDPPARALGARYEFQPAGLRITHVLSGTAAQRAGLAPGDLMVALDGERITQANLTDLMRRAAGDEVEIHYFHRDRLTVSMLPLQPAPADTCDLWLLPSHEADSVVSMRRNAWLRSARSSGA